MRLPPAETAAAGSDLAELTKRRGPPDLEAMDQHRENLSPRAVEDLYRGTVRLSASRMDKVKSCHYAYFLQYGLKAKPGSPPGWTPRRRALLYTMCWSMCFAARDAGGVAGLDETEVKKLGQAGHGTVHSRKLGGMEDKTPRFRYLFRRLAQSAAQVVEQMVEELQASDFQPIAFELGFGPNQELPPVRLQVDGITVAISGFVDRVDGWVHDGRLYVRVMDYKTGHKSFDLTDVWHGLNLQMLLYLFTLEEKGLPGESRPIVPASAPSACPGGAPDRQPEYGPGEASEGAGQQAAAQRPDPERPQVVEAMEHVPLGSDAVFAGPGHKRTGAISRDALASAVQLGKLQKAYPPDFCGTLPGRSAAATFRRPLVPDEQSTACRWCDFASACHLRTAGAGSAAITSTR